MAQPDRPLNDSEIAQILSGIASAPCPPSVTHLALSATVNGLALWCDTDQVERAHANITPRADLSRFIS